jgi:hypothetical protein
MNFVAAVSAPVDLVKATPRLIFTAKYRYAVQQEAFFQGTVS